MKQQSAIKLKGEDYINSRYNGICDVIVVLNERVEIQKVNQIVSTLLGYTEDELYHQSIGILLQKKEFDLVRDTIRNSYARKKIQEVGLNLVSKENKIIPVSCSFSPLRNENGALTGILMVAKNISTLIEAQQQLNDKNDELNLFVYKASHDLKSPVASIKGLMSLIKQSKNKNDIKTYHNLIDEGIEKLDKVMSDLMILGQITYKELIYEEIETKSLINDILKSIQFTDGYNDITFNISFENAAHRIISEKGLFRTILFNLIDNSVKYKKERNVPSLIRINVSRHKNGILMQISDNGIGIEKIHHADNFSG